MGVKIMELFAPQEIKISDLSGKIMAVDTSNHLYQFLSSIRQGDGSPLTDSHGNITSHLVGLLSRSINLMQQGVKLVFILDGVPPKLKIEEINRRKEIKKEAQKQFEIAKERDDLSGMKKYAQRTSKLTKEMVAEAKELLDGLGIPTIQAPSEGEAQASFLVRRGDAYAVASQDADSLLFGCPRLVKNLSIAGKRKKPGTLSFETVNPEMIELNAGLTSLGLSHDQLIVLGILVGTDFNMGGIHGIGPKKALKLLKDKGNDFDSIFKEVDWDKHYAYSWKEVYDLFHNIPVEKEYKIEWKDPNPDKVKKILVDKHDFSSQRVDSAIQGMMKSREEKKQKSLGDFFH